MGATQVQYSIGGMNCSFCADTIDTALSDIDGVDDVAVSLAHEEVVIEYDDTQTGEQHLQAVLEDLGYTIRDPAEQRKRRAQQQELATARRRLKWSAVTAGLALVLMGVMVARQGWNIFAETEQRWMWVGALGLAVVTMFGPGYAIKTKAYNSLRRGILNQHVLLEAGAFAGLLGGVLGWVVYPGLGFPVVHFFVVSTFITTYHILSEYASLHVRITASQAVQDLLDQQPDTAHRVTEDGVESVPVDDLTVGDRIRVKPGETIPIDGQIITGESAVDESVATGESTPIDKQPGDSVIGGSINETGSLLIEVTDTGEDLFLNRVAHQIEEARAMKPDLVALTDRILQYFVPAVLGISVAAFLFWVVVPSVVSDTVLGTGPQVETAIFAALSVLVLGYPCALGMATPLALIRGGGHAAEQGILMRGGTAFQAYPDVDTIVFDKTGTITEGDPSVDTITPLHDHSKTTVVRSAAIAETFSEHPLASAVLEETTRREIAYPDPDEFQAIAGHGVKAIHEGETLRVGKPDWLADAGVPIDDGKDAITALQDRGLTVIGVGRDDTLIGVIGIGDQPKPDAEPTIHRVRDVGITPMMLTGDNHRTAATIADAVGIETVQAEVLPDEKREEIQRLQTNGRRVAMVGDGINDAPALTQADVGLAIGAGTDIALESADIILLGDRLEGVMDAYDIATDSYRTTRQNLVAAFTFNGVGVAAATTGVVHPVFAMLAMIGSVSVVLANSFGYSLFTTEGWVPSVSFDTSQPDATESGRDGSSEAESPSETVAFEVDLHCSGCETRVTDTLNDFDAVTSVTADADAERVQVTYDPQQHNRDTLSTAISDLGFTVDPGPETIE